MDPKCVRQYPFCLLPAKPPEMQGHYWGHNVSGSVIPEETQSESGDLREMI